MANYPLNKIILFEYDKPIDLDELLNAEAGIWSWVITNTVETITDDNGNIGYYDYQQSIIYNVKSFSVDNEFYAKVTSLADLRVTNKSFYYEFDTRKIYIHFDGFEPPLAQVLFFGGAVGYSKMPNNKQGPYFNNIYYEPLLSNVSSIKKSVDALFFGLLTFTKASADLINKSGEFDDWRSRDLFGQPARFMVGNVDDDYDDFDTVFEGYISDDTRDFDEFSIDIEDPRKALTQPVATNTLTTTDWPNLNDSNVDAVKPVAYGTILNAKSICLNEEETTPTYYTFLICDTEFNTVESLDTIYVDGTETTITGTADLTAGTFTMTYASVDGDLGNVTIDFTATDFDNGVEILKDLMFNYDSRNFIASFWDVDEVDEAELLSRSSSLYVSSGSKKLSKSIEDVANDIDARFFNKNDGLYTIRIYDEDRDPIEKELINDEWQDYPTIVNNGSEYLSSAIIEYSQDIDGGEALQYENTDYQSEAFDRYKKLKVDTFSTNLPTLADAMDKSETIMNISKEVQDLVTRTTSWDNFGLEPTDFVIGSPSTRDKEDSDRNIYEILEVENDLEDFMVSLTLRYIKAADAEKTYSTIDDNTDIPIDDSNDINLTARLT